MMVQCAGCDRPIMDRFLLNVLDRSWHTSCVKCIDCKMNLSEKCFFRDGKLYCRTDFFRRYGTKCAGCLHGISPNDLVRRARSKVFHLKCFTCIVCRKQLSTGEELYVLEENKFICKEDFISSKYGDDSKMLVNEHFDGSDVEDDCDMDSGIDTLGNISEKDFPLDCENSPQATKESILNSLTQALKPNNNDNCSFLDTPCGVRNSNSGNINNQQINTSLGAHMDRLVSSSTVSHNNSNGIRNLSLTNCSPNLSVSNGSIGICPLLSPRTNSPPSAQSIKEEPDCSNLDSSPGSVDSNCSNIINEGSSERGGGADGNTNDSCPSPSIGNDSPGNGETNNSGSNNINGSSTVGAKRRGPRTTIKAKQLETLKSAFAATPKPTRHIREQLAQETGLNMRVIQVWFQNRRSKERRMKQLTALGARRHFFRNPRRMRVLRPGEELVDSPDMMGPGFGYLDNGGDYYPGYQGYNEFFMGQSQEGRPPGLAFLQSSHGSPALSMDGPLHPSSIVRDGQFLQRDIMSPSTPEPTSISQHDPFGIPRGLGHHFSQSISPSLAHHHPHHHPHLQQLSEMTSEVW